MSQLHRHIAIEGALQSRQRSERAVTLLTQLMALWLLLGALGLSSCIPKMPQDFKQENELYDHSMTLFKEESDTEALRFLEAFKSRYPLSARAADVELAIADIYFRRYDSIEAVESYNLFIELYPSHPKRTYAILQAAKSHVQLVPSSVDRDLTHVHKTIERLQMIQNDPTYGKEAHKLIRTSQRTLAERHRYVADFYMKTGRWNSAEGRLRLLKKEPFVDLRDGAMFDLIRLYLWKEDEEAARKELAELLQTSKDEALRTRAQALLNPKQKDKGKDD